jgi:adenylate kinase family enzyme
MSIDINDVLKNRGILDVCIKMGWVQRPLITRKKDDKGKPINNEFITHSDLMGWEYPIFNAKGEPHSTTDLRWRSGKPNAQENKFAWQRNGQPKGARYYFSPMLKHAIEKAMGTIILAGGDLDFLTFMAAGKENCLTWFGEDAVPPTLAKDLQLLGVKKAIMYPDCDEVGMKSAWKVHKLLSTVGIEFECHRLPYEFGSKKDTNDAWIEAKFKIIPFFRLLNACELIAPEELELYSNEVKRKMHGATIPQEFAGECWQAYKAEVVKALGAPHEQKGGHDYWHCPLPTHPDNQASFRISYDTVDTGWPVCSCGIQGDGKDAWRVVGAAVGVEWGKFLEEQKVAKGYKQDAPRPTNGKLPDSSNGHRPAPADLEPPPDEADYLPDVPQTSKPSRSKVTKSDDFADHFVTRTEALGGLERKLVGDEISNYETIQMPFKVLRESGLGGYTRVMRVGKQMLVIGATGGGKTTFAECLTDRLIALGFNGLVFSPEWSPEEFAMRAAHRYRNGHGGLTTSDMALHIQRIYEEFKDIPEDKRSGVNGGDHVQTTINIVRNLRQVRGEVHYFAKKRGMTFQVMFDMLTRRIEQEQKAGRPIHFFICDYMERLPSNGVRSFEWMEWAAEEIKTWGTDCNTHNIIFAQPRKDDNTSAYEGELLGVDAARNLTGNQFNLVTTLGRKVDENGQRIHGVGVLNIPKNSEGDTGTLEMVTDFANLKWVDEKPHYTHVNLNS